MKGVNKMQLNAATMQEAIHYWLADKVFQSDVKFEVTEVTVSADYTALQEFIVTTKSEEEKVDG